MDISVIKKRFFPSFYENEAPRLIEFIKYYLVWMQQEGNPYWTIDNLKDFTSIDYTIDKYADHLKNELMQNFPFEYVGDLKYIMKHLVMLYQSKGTLASYKFFFRAVFNSFCNIFYPRDLILRVSDGKWIQGYYLYCEDVPLDNIMDLTGRPVREVETGLTGMISDILPHYFTGESEYRYCFIIADNLKQFSQGNHLVIDGLEGEYRITKAEYSEGYWEGTDGFLSSDHVLQDGYYYQQFSYELTTLVPFNEWKDILKKLLHPAGLQMFGRYQLIEKIEPIGCDGDNVKTTFLRWWIIHSMNYVINSLVRLCGNSWIIKKKPDVYQFPYTADLQYWYKQYGRVETVHTMTPNQLETVYNASNKIIFIDSRHVTADWAHWKLPIPTTTYDIVGILANDPVLQLECKNGIIDIPEDRHYSTAEPYPFIFIDGLKIPESQITKTTSRITLSGKQNGTATIYSIAPNYFTSKIVKTINSNEIKIKGISLDQIIVFLNGELVNHNCDYNLETGVLTLPSNSGMLELYVANHNQDRVVEHYILPENEDGVLYIHLPLKNIQSGMESPKRSEMIRFLKYQTFQFPYNADMQALNKLYGLTESMSEWNASEVLSRTNDSSKLFFHNGKLRRVDWINYKIPEENNIEVDYIISGIKAQYPHIERECHHGTIQTVPNYINPAKVTNAKILIFVNGIKVPEADVTTFEYGYKVPVRYDGPADIYFVDESIVDNYFYMSTATTNLVIGTGLSRQRLLAFADGNMIFDDIVYHSNGILDITISNSRIEIYVLKEYENYRTIAYKSHKKYEYWSNPNKILCCYNPEKNIIPSI